MISILQTYILNTLKLLHDFEFKLYFSHKKNPVRRGEQDLIVY